MNIPNTAYIGIGIVEEPALPTKEIRFVVNDREQSISEMTLKGRYLKDTDKPEKMVKVRWIKPHPESPRLSRRQVLGNENAVNRPVADR